MPNILIQTLNEKESDLIQINERNKTDFEKRLKVYQKDIEKIDQYKDNCHDLEIKLKSKKKVLNVKFFFKNLNKNSFFKKRKPTIKSE